MVPVVAPLIESPRRLTAIPAPLTVTPVVPVARMEPKVPVQSMVIDLVIVTGPNPPASRQSISPPDAVLEMAPANVLHGAVRVHELMSSPRPETQVRVACACAGPVPGNGRQMRLRAVSSSEVLMAGFLHRVPEYATDQPPISRSKRHIGAK